MRWSEAEPNTYALIETTTSGAAGRYPSELYGRILFYSRRYRSTSTLSNSSVGSRALHRLVFDGHRKTLLLIGSALDTDPRFRTQGRYFLVQGKSRRRQYYTSRSIRQTLLRHIRINENIFVSSMLKLCYNVGTSGKASLIERFSRRQ